MASIRKLDQLAFWSVSAQLSETSEYACFPFPPVFLKISNSLFLPTTYNETRLHIFQQYVAAIGPSAAMNMDGSSSGSV